MPGTTRRKWMPFFLFKISPMEEVLNIINQNAAITGNLSGISLVQISNMVAIPMKEIREILNQIHAEKKIRIREGIHGKLVFAN